MSRRGLLSITSQRQPYLRAGLAWPTREAVEKDVRELDGKAFLELVTDPVLTVLVGDDDGTFKPLPTLPDDLSVSQVDMMIEGMIADLGPIMPRNGESDADKLKAAGFEDLDALLASHALAMAASIDITSAAMAAGYVADEDLITWLVGRFTALATTQSLLDSAQIQLGAVQADVLRLQGELAEANAEGDDLAPEVARLTALVASLESENAALKAGHKSPKPKTNPKPGAGDNA